ncbi:MAG: RES family NAD+ phosphorylase [Cyclobacteriaceae bacterium]|nr:MAG: RES family NAD+ phosphorylase [Cyclobacteriaceae bacterium]
MIRARQHDKKDKVRACKDIGPLSPAMAKYANRFSPPGIPMFYASQKAQTAISEVIDRKKRKQSITVACFRNTKPLTLVDLTKIPELSIFDLQRSDFYEASVFLKKFTKQISRRIKKKGGENFEYVPTQVITEYLKHAFPVEYKVSIDGLIYPSSVAQGEHCYVIFADSRHCADEGKQSKRTKLILVKDSIETVPVKKLIRKK